MKSSKGQIRHDMSGRLNRSVYLRKRNNYSCEVCLENYPEEVLEFHHPDSSLKEIHLSSKAFRGVLQPKQKVIDEADDCIVLCSNCDRLEHVALKNGETLINDKEAYLRYRNHRFSSYKNLDDRNEGFTDGEEEEFPCAFV